jgi:NAD(P)-dependent dehydrogenase (short-subunit alcohol dehydrogenase family)
MAQRLAGKIALITGAASGLGRAMAQMFLAQGARVVMTDINFDGVQEVAAPYGAQALALAHDVTNAQDWEAVIEDGAEAFGGLHILVNNAGIGRGGSIEETSFEDWRHVHAVDLDSVFWGCKLAIPEIVATIKADGTRGSILNISSIAGVIAAPNMAAYNSAKAAVRHLSKSVALHCARQGYAITCNSLHPVFIDTPILNDLGPGAPREALLAKLGRQIPLGRVGEPDDVAYAALYLCSDEAKFVTGSELYVDGGISAM